MKTRIISILCLSVSFICGANIIVAQPHSPKVIHQSIKTPPPPPPMKMAKKIPAPRIFSPIGHVYGFSVPGHKMLLNFCTNGLVYREGDKIGRPFTLRGNVITVYNNRIAQRIIATGKINKNGKSIDWLEYSNGTKYRLSLIG